MKKRDWTGILQTGDAFGAYIKTEIHPHRSDPQESRPRRIGAFA